MSDLKEKIVNKRKRELDILSGFTVDVNDCYYNEDETLFTIEYEDGLVEINHINPINKDLVDVREFSSGGFQYFRYDENGNMIYKRDEQGIIWIRDAEGSMVIKEDIV